MRATLALALACALLAGLSGRPAHAEEPVFSVKPSPLAPAGPPGETRRTVQSFGTWTLVCDENLKQRQRVCNISQEIADASGRTAFSWSLAGTREGAPVMILRAPQPPSGPPDVVLAFAGGAGATVRLGTCGGALCLGFLQVTKEIGRALREDDHADATLTVGDGPRTLHLPLRDLKTALAALGGERPSAKSTISRSGRSAAPPVQNMK